MFREAVVYAAVAFVVAQVANIALLLRLAGPGGASAEEVQHRVASSRKAPPRERPAQAVESGFLEVADGRLYYEVAGEGEAIVFLHDGLTHAGVWDPQFQRLADSFRVIRYDRRGFGRSSVPTGSYSPAEDLHRLSGHLGVDRAVLVGGSSGGRLALDYALAHPSRVSGLVLIGAVVSGLGFSDHFLERGRRNMAPLSDGDVAATVEKWVEDRYWIAPGNAGARERIRAVVARYAEKRFLEHRPELAVRSGPPALGRLGEIEAPTLVVVGAEDIPDVHAHAGAIDAAIRDSRRVVVPDAGHLVAFERPEAFDRLLRDFLGAL